MICFISQVLVYQTIYLIQWRQARLELDRFQDDALLLCTWVQGHVPRSKNYLLH